MRAFVKVPEYDLYNTNVHRAILIVQLKFEKKTVRQRTSPIDIARTL